MRLSDAVYLVTGGIMFVAVVIHTNIIRDIVDKIKGTKPGWWGWHPAFGCGYYQPITPETHPSVIYNQYMPGSPSCGGVITPETHPSQIQYVPPDHTTSTRHKKEKQTRTQGS